MSWTPSPTRPAFRDASDSRRPNHNHGRAATSPPGFPQSSPYLSPPLSLPPSLIPGRRTTNSTDFVNNATVFFKHARPSYSFRPDAPNLPLKTEVLVPLTRTEPAITSPPPLPRKPPALQANASAPAPPRLPPKPFASSNEPLSFYNQAIPAAMTIPIPTLEMAIPPPASTSPEAINEYDVSDLTSQEPADRLREVGSPTSPGEEVARALEETMRFADSSSQSPLLHPYSKPSDSSNPQGSHVSYPSTLASSSSSSRSPPQTPATSVFSSSPTSAVAVPRPLTPADVRNQLAEDEALARRLEAEDREAFEAGDSAHIRPPTSATSPAYSPHNAARPLRNPLPSPSIPSVGRSGSTSSNGHDSAGSSTLSHTPRRAYSSTDATSPTSSAVGHFAPQISASTLLSSSSSMGSDEERSAISSAEIHPRNISISNQFVEHDLLMGVSFGFHPPSVGVQQPQMKGPLPNIISLPYGKCPPMHIQAPSWRQLLKLMAKLSATRIEPSLEAMAVTKGQLKLRTVVQFIKVHHASSDWRTVIYLTIDCKPNPDQPNVSKYTNGDVNTLPYSYALSSLPAILRDGPDSSLSKYFTIPATATTPLPSLPISLPSMALYLASALEDSRQALNDSSSGAKRLAKMVDHFYPNDSSGSLDDLADGAERRSLFNRLMKRTKQPTRTRNSDMYELVTPFVPDEWG